VLIAVPDFDARCNPVESIVVGLTVKVIPSMSHFDDKMRVCRRTPIPLLLHPQIPPQ
jgi:hypothetical protein